MDEDSEEEVHLKKRAKGLAKPTIHSLAPTIPPPPFHVPSTVAAQLLHHLHRWNTRDKQKSKLPLLARSTDLLGEVKGAAQIPLPVLVSNT